VQTTSIQKTYKNKILASLPASVIEQLVPHLVPVSLPKEQTLHRPGQPVDRVYFLEEGI
jgi:hypothetical protein